MVVQKTINKLKERPKDEKTVVATSGAVLVVIILLLGWGLWFVQKAKRGGEFDTYISTKQDSFMAPGVRDAEKALQETMRPNAELLRELKDTSVDVPQLQQGGGSDDSNVFTIPENAGNL